eukprot:343244-Rhodomonas_salina.1
MLVRVGRWASAVVACRHACYVMPGPDMTNATCVYPLSASGLPDGPACLHCYVKPGTGLASALGHRGRRCRV